MALPVSGSSAGTIPSFPPCHCLVEGVWHSSIRAQGAPGRNLHSGSVSHFRDLYSPEQFQAASCSLRPLPPCVFPMLCVWTVKEIYSKTSQTKLKVCVCVTVCVCVCVCVCVGGEREPYFLCLDELFIWKCWGRVTVYLCGTLELAQGGGTSTFYTLSCFHGVTLTQWSGSSSQKKHAHSSPMFHPVHSQITIDGIIILNILNKLSHLYQRTIRTNLPQMLR